MFRMRTSLPEYGNKFYNRTSAGGYSLCIQGSPTCAGRNVLSNCVGWACSRFNEIYSELTGYRGMKYNALNCNAENFIERARNTYGLQVVSYPVMGGIMVWQKGASLSGNDGAGHVEVVEDIYSSNSIYTSASNYGGTTFYNARRNNNNGRWGLGSGYTFRGCIVNPAVGVVTTGRGGSTSTNTNQGVNTSNGYTGKFNIGDRVVINGALYGSSTAKNASGSVSNKTTTITRIARNTAHPYNTTGDLGWMDEGSIRKIVNETPAAPSTSSGWPKSYTVVKGDTLSGIAEKFYGNGDANHYNFIARANGIANPNIIIEGQRLTIPAYTGGSSSSGSSGFNIGDKVVITGGYASSAYSGSAPNTKMKGATRYIVKIYSGARFPYQLGARPGDSSSSNTTGFANANSIRKA